MVLVKQPTHESTLSGYGYVERLQNLKTLGYSLVIFYLRVSDVNIAIKRVVNRVLEGGHHVPENDIRRRFKLGWNNFEKHYKNLADDWAIYDNSGKEFELLNASWDG